MRAAFRAGVVYFAVVFVAGFVLGAVRTLWLEPRLGAVAATLLELPVILGFAWAACARILERGAVPPTSAARSLMGGFAFALLMTAEVGLGAFLTGSVPVDFADRWSTPAAVIGLAGQLAFAAFPLMQRSAAGSHE